MWKLAFKKYEVIWSAQAKNITWNFLKAVFHNFYFVHSWILCPKHSHSGVFYSLNALKMKKSFKKLCIVNSFVGEIEYYCPADLLKTFPAMNKTAYFFSWISKIFRAKYVQIYSLYLDIAFDGFWCSFDLLDIFILSMRKTIFRQILYYMST